MAKAVAIKFKKLGVRYSTEDVCQTKLIRLRFPKDFVHPVFGCRDILPSGAAILASVVPVGIRPTSLPVLFMHRTKLLLTIALLWGSAMVLSAMFLTKSAL